MSLINELKELGADVNDGLNRFMNNSSLYETCLRKFIAAAKNLEVLPCFETGDYEKAVNNAHTLKGLTGNLSITPLYSAYTEIVAMLRNNETENAKKTLMDIIPVQEKIIECIEKYS